MDAREVKAYGFSKALKEASKNFATRTRPTKRMRFSAFMGQSFRLYQETYYGQLEGHLAVRVWREAEAALRDINGYPGVHAWWRTRSHWFSEDLRSSLISYSRQPTLQGC